jgi:hypothetical protein
MATRRIPRSRGVSRSRPLLLGAIALTLIVRPSLAGVEDRVGGGGRSGIELVWRTLRATPPTWWDVTEAVTDRRVIRVQMRWGFTPLPPGTYHVEAQFDGVAGTARDVAVRPGAVTRITPGDLGLGQLMIELPAGRGLVPIPGLPRLEAHLVQGDHVRPLVPAKDGDPQMTLWAREGPATVRFRGGSLLLEEPAQVIRGMTRHVPFDAEAVAAQLGLGLVSVVIRDPSGKAATRDTQVTLLDSRGEHLLVLTPDPLPGATWLVPPGPVVRARLGRRELVRRDVPAGPKAALVFDFEPEPKPGGPVKIRVDVAIESPAEGTVVDGDRTTVIGRASTTGPAGATRIALVADVSGSADASCGADLDGDGHPESIIQAEVAAGRVLLEELEKVEGRTPGTAFEVTIVRFASGAMTMTPLRRMSEAAGVAALRQALDRVARDGSQGDTNYLAALDEATRALQVVERPGPCIILFLSDGEPNELRPSLDAAARTGLARVVIHTFGLGQAFLGAVDSRVAFPPDPRGGVNVLAAVAALGGPTGTVTALPRPADIVPIIPRLPVLELPEAELKEVQVVNETTGKPAIPPVQLSNDGAFQAEVPVSLLPGGAHEANTLVATAVARDGISKASDRVTVQCPPQPGTLTVLYRAKEGGPPLPPALMPACELILDSSRSMIEPVETKPKYLIARAVLQDLMKTLPDGCYLGLRLYGHWGFIPHAPNRPPPPPAAQDPRRKTDSQLVEPIGLLDAARRRRIGRTIEQAWPRGDTPMFYSLVQAKADFPARWQGSQLVVLISDGEENCGGKVEDVAAAYRDAGIGVAIHVVGFDIRGIAAKQQLEEVARIGSGRYFDARDARQLAEALRQAVASAPYTIYDADGKTEVARGLINDPPISLMPGRYRVGLVGDRGERLPISLRNRQGIAIFVDEAGRLVAPEGGVGPGAGVVPPAPGTDTTPDAISEP